MILFCEPCNKCHAVTAGEVERMVYTYQGELLDAENSGVNKHAKTWCILEVLSSSYSPECYLEHAQALLECRQAETSIARPAA